MKRNTYQLNHSGAGVMLTVCMGPRKVKQFDGGLSQSQDDNGSYRWAGIYSGSRDWSEALQNRVEELESINIRRHRKGELSSVSDELLTEIFEDETMSEDKMISIAEIRRMAKKYVYDYPKADNTATVVLFWKDPNDRLYILMGRRGENVDTYPGMWCLPGGFLNIGTETVKDAAVREVKEETGIDITVDDLKLFDVHSDPDTDPRGHVVNTCYMVFITTEQLNNSVAGDDLSELDRIAIDGVEHMDLAFNHKDLAVKAILEVSGE